MPRIKRKYGFLDKVIIEVDRGLRTVSGSKPPATRPYPKADLINPIDLIDLKQRRQSGAFMRINHCGEVCAQALYNGQAVTAQHPRVRGLLHTLAQEEVDHLAWCHQRLDELGAHRSYLNFFWYFASFSIGLLAGLVGDKWSLAFVEETEAQVGKHLQKHLDIIQARDLQSAAIIAVMQQDEARHAHTATHYGAATLPQSIKYVMKAQAKVMTSCAYWL